jgi:two-component system, LytTR family, response regulator
MTVRALIAEDEAPARENLKEYLAEVPWLAVVGEARDGAEALAAIDTLKPDLLFLDVRLPELSGLEVARRMRHACEIVFTTAYDRFAIAAFELGALDYLLKPFGRERFVAALARVRERLGQATVPDAERARAALEPGSLRRLFVRQGERIVPIPTRSIVRVQAAGDYAEVHTASGTFLLHLSLGELVLRLDPGTFEQVHRSHIVNLDEVREMRPFDERRLVLYLKNGEEVVASRSASEGLRRRVR